MPNLGGAKIRSVFILITFWKVRLFRGETVKRFWFLVLFCQYFCSSHSESVSIQLKRQWFVLLFHVFIKWDSWMLLTFYKLITNDQNNTYFVLVCFLLMSLLRFAIII
jgi:hypothetical protein